MKRRVIADLRFETSDKRATFKLGLDDKIGNMQIFHSSVTQGEDEEGNPQTTADIRPEHKEDADDLFQDIKSRMETIPALKGSVSWHDCKHDEPPENGEPCRPQETYVKE